MRERVIFWVCKLNAYEAPFIVRCRLIDVIFYGVFSNLFYVTYDIILNIPPL